MDDRIKWNKLTKPNTEAVWRTWKIGRKMAEAEEVESEEVAVHSTKVRPSTSWYMWMPLLPTVSRTCQALPTSTGQVDV